MKPVKQLICKGEDNGDCFRACVASILEIAINEIPNFANLEHSDEEFWKLNNAWASCKNYKYVTIYLERQNWHIVDGIFCIASAKSPRRKDQYHAVVWHGGIVHDPHPSNDFLAEAPTQFTLLVPFNMRSKNERN